MHNWARLCLVVTTIIIASYPTSVQSQTAADAIRIINNETGFGARALAMGGAYTAVANDFSAIYWNPSGLASIPGGSIFVEGGKDILSNNVQYMSGTTPNTDENNFLGAVGLVAAVPTVRGSFVIAVGINRIASYENYLNFSGFSNVDNGLGFTFIENEQEVVYPFSANVLREEEVRSTGGIDQISFGMGVALSPRTTAGLSFSSLGNSEEYRFLFTQEDSKNNHQTFPADFDHYKVTQNLSLEGTAIQFKGGIMTALTRSIKVGLSLALPSTFEITEQHYIKETLTFDDGTKSDTTTAGFWEYKVKTPMILDGGLSLSNQSFTIASSIRFRDWSSTSFDLKKIPSDSDLYQDLDSENQILSSDYEPTVELHIGGEYVLRIGGLAVSFRGGYSTYPSPFFSQSNPDRDFLTGGVAISPTQRFIINCTFLNSSWNRESSDSYTPSGTIEELISTTVIINATFRI